MGNEFRVNSYQSNWQRDSDVIALNDGGFLVVWDSYLNNYNDGPTATYVAAQRYNANGVAVGGEQIIDGIDGCSSSSARVTLLTDGAYVVVWEFDNYDDILTIRKTVYAKVYNADGTARTDAVRVDTVAANDAVAPEAVATANGGFKVLFGVSRSTALFDQVYSQQFDANAGAIGVNTLVNTNVGEFDQIYVRSATLTNGTTISIWNSEASFFVPGSSLDSNEIRGTLYGANGAVLNGDFSLGDNIGTVGGNNGAGYDVAALANGGFVVSRLAYDFELGLDTPATSYYMVMQFYTAAGVAQGGPRTIFASDDLSNGTRIVQLATGQILVVWSQDPMQAQISDDVYGRIFSASGIALTGTFEISVDADSYDEQGAPEVAALAGGGFVVTYDSESIDNDNQGIAGRIYGRGTNLSDLLTVDATGMLVGLNGNDTLTGDNRANVLIGGVGNDVLSGLAGKDKLYGDNGLDTLYGGTSNDDLRGGAGNDLLYGGDAADQFVFDTVLSSTNRDVIADFDAFDRIVLDNAVFNTVGANGVFAADRFKVIGQGGVVDATDRILYNQVTGVLYLDADGAGGVAAKIMATLTGAPVLTFDDIYII